MKIGNEADNLSRITPQEKTSSTTGAKTASNSSGSPQLSKTDSAELSAAANQLSQLPSESEVRLDKVASIQSALLAGTYHVDAKDVAKKLVDSLLTQEV